MRQLLSIDDLSPAEIRDFTSPDEVSLPARSQTLRGTLGCLFRQPSLRTLSSFARAGVGLGLAPVTVSTTGDAFRDRCDFNDEIRQLALTSTCVVVRRESPIDRAAISECEAPVVNAGDGCNEHPTQALVDLAAMRQFGLDGKHVVLMGNLRDHRVHHSLAKALARLGISFTPVCPPGYEMPERFLPAGTACTQVSTSEEVDDIVRGADFIYVTMGSSYQVPTLPRNRAMSFDLARARRVLRPSARILHPFPRHDELSCDLDGTAFDAYHMQTRLGPVVRYRVLRSLVEGAPPGRLAA